MPASALSWHWWQCLSHSSCDCPHFQNECFCVYPRLLGRAHEAMQDSAAAVAPSGFSVMVWLMLAGCGSSDSVVSGVLAVVCGWTPPPLPLGFLLNPCRCCWMGVGEVVEGQGNLLSRWGCLLPSGGGGCLLMSLVQVTPWCWVGHGMSCLVPVDTQLWTELAHLLSVGD